MKPAEAFAFIDHLLSSQKLTLTPPEFARFMEAMQVVHKAIQTPEKTELATAT